MIKQALKLAAILLLAFTGGIFGSQVLWPYFIGWNIAASDSKAPVYYVTQKQDVTIAESQALKDAINKVAAVSVGVKSTTAKGAVSQGSGIILTSDGLAAVPADLLQNAQIEITASGQKPSYQIIKRNKTQNVAILKLDSANFSTASFYQLDTLKLGEKVFLIGTSANTRFVAAGIIRSFNLAVNAIETDIIEKPEAAGAPVFDLQGNILGIARLDKTNRVDITPITQIKSLSGL